jgi:hypothetical protein
VNCFETEARRKQVAGTQGMPSSSTAAP